MLELKNISLSVEDEFTGNGQKEILRDVSLTIETGKLVVVTGPNGGGKSTMAKMIAGILRPNQGQILLDGEDVTDLDITQRATRGISFAFQQPVRFKGITVRDLINLASGREISDCEACGYLKEVGLCARDYIDREVNASLSGGEIKRIEIATVMARKTKLTLFDEPEAGIDLWSFQSLIKVFEDMYARTRGSILIISHQERIIQMADKIMVIEDGQVKEYGTKEDVLPTLFQQKTGRMCGQEGGTC